MSPQPPPASTSIFQHHNPSATPRLHLTEKIHKLNLEIAEYDAKIEKLKEWRQSCVDERNNFIAQRDHSHSASHPSLSANQPNNGLNYQEDIFDWSNALEKKMKDVFNIQSFRLCQRGVCNAALDGRDIVCIMPTGGGKSLTYQLPALFGFGVTVVISPLISLIADQIMHLQQAGVEAVKLTSTISNADSKDIYHRLQACATDTLGPDDKPIKLCYLTPEKLSKSRQIQKVLSKLANSRKLDRIVVDEAHCVSQLGHDFRPDYGKLHFLRQSLCPHVPITALSATCPPEVLKDLVKILCLHPIADGKDAPPDRTTVFTAPLYRKNLHYTVVPKTGKDSVKWMVDYILQEHPQQSGIIYCTSKNNAESVAKRLSLESGNKITTGVYHAHRSNQEKEQLHEAWHDNKIQVVCATIAFGMGIDKRDVRFVIHDTISKSLDGYYQESGRAGRDGQDADCVLLYRPQDYTTVGSMVAHEKDGLKKLKAISRFAQDLESCRKIQFVDYFTFSVNMDISFWSTEEVGAQDRCGHCDNCQRCADDIVKMDLTYEAWQTLKVSEELSQVGENVTIGLLADRVRGRGGSTSTSTKGKQKKARVSFDLAEVCGGAVGLSDDHTSRLIVHLVEEGFLKEDLHTNSYNDILYVVPGRHAMSLTRHGSKAELLARGTRKIEMCFTSKPSKKRATKRQTNTRKEKPAAPCLSLSDDDDQPVAGPSRERSGRPPLPSRDDTASQGAARTYSTLGNGSLKRKHAVVIDVLDDDTEYEGGAGEDEGEDRHATDHDVGVSWQANQRGELLTRPHSFLRQEPMGPSSLPVIEILDSEDDGDEEIGG